jgi:hypothetical protein
MRWKLFSLAIVFVGCKHLGYYNDPVISTVQSRTQGGCHSQCSPGWQCNTETGLCEEIPATTKEVPLNPTMQPDSGR